MKKREMKNIEIKGRGRVKEREFSEEEERKAGFEGKKGLRERRISKREGGGEDGK